MSEDAVLIVNLVMGTPTVGLWCRACLLPSAVEADVHVLTEDGPQRVGAVRTCTQEGHQ